MKACSGSRRSTSACSEATDATEDLQTLDDVCDSIFGRSFCALGDGATSPVKSSLKYFRDEYEYLVANGRLPEGLERHAGVVTDNAGRHRPEQQLVAG